MQAGSGWSAADWLRAAGPPVAAWYASAPEVRSGFGEHAWSVLSGEPDPDHNWIAIHADGQTGEFSLRSRIASLRSAGLPGTVCVLGASEPALVPLLFDLGLTRVGPLPHYAVELQAAGSTQGDDERDVTVTDPDGFRAIMALFERTFEFSQGYTGRCFSPSLLHDPSLRVSMIARDGAPASACVTWTAGELAYLVIMATAPEWQGRGLGTSLVRSAMHAAQETGARWMHLVASDAGARLYRKIGFELVAEHVLWTT